MKRMFKKFVGLVLALSLVLTLLCPSFVAIAADEELDLVFDIAEDYSDTQGQNNWYYKYRTVTNGVEGSLTEYSYQSSWGTGRWAAGSQDREHGIIVGPSDGGFGANGMVVGQTSSDDIAYNPVREFVSPYNGTATITSPTLQGGSIYTIVYARILKNGEKIWPSDKDWFTISGNAANAFEGLNVNLYAGDSIVFEVKRAKFSEMTAGYTGDQQRISWNPVITYAEGAKKPLDLVFNASEDYSGVQGQNNWYYKNRKVYNDVETINTLVYSTSNNRWYETSGNRNHGMICGPQDTGSNTQDGWFVGNVKNSDFATQGDTLFYNPIKEFVSPYNGTATITATMLKGFSADTKAYVRILKNGEKIWPSSDAWYYILGTDEKATDLTSNVSLEAGDSLIFEVQRATIGTGENQISDSTDMFNKQAVKWIPVITYNKGVTLPAEPEVVFSDDFTTEKSQWYSIISQDESTYEIDTANGVMKLNADASDNNVSYALAMPYADEYTVEFDMTISNSNATSSATGFYFGFHSLSTNAAANDYNVYFDISKTDTNNLVWRWQGGDALGLTGARKNSGISDWTAKTYNVKLTAKGHTATLVIDDTHTFSYDYAPYLVGDYAMRAHPAGGIELRAVRCDMVIDNFEITGIKEGLSIGDVTLTADEKSVVAKSIVKVPLDFDVEKDINMITAVYDNNALVAVGMDSIKATVANSRELTATAISEEEIPSSANVKVFFWDNDESGYKYLSPLKNAVETIKSTILAD